MLVDNETSGGIQKPRVHWRVPFERLRGSSDDGDHLLWLTFADDGEQVITHELLV